MGRPCRRSDQPAVHMGLVHWNINIRAAGTGDIRPHRRISGAGSAFEDSGCGQQLCAVADGCNGLVRLRKVLHQLQHGRVQANVFRCPPAGNDQRVALTSAKVAFSTKLCPGFSL